MKRAHKDDLKKAVSANIIDVPEEDIKLTINLLFDYMSNKLAEEKRIEIRGFGSFSLRSRKCQKNHKENDELSYKTIYFRGSKNFKNANN